jgi:hypothetical protein
LAVFSIAAGVLVGIRALLVVIGIHEDEPAVLPFAVSVASRSIARAGGYVPSFDGS